MSLPPVIGLGIFHNCVACSLRIVRPGRLATATAHASENGISACEGGAPCTATGVATVLAADHRTQRARAPGLRL
jgi:hypothetical protein